MCSHGIPHKIPAADNVTSVGFSWKIGLKNPHVMQVYRKVSGFMSIKENDSETIQDMRDDFYSILKNRAEEFIHCTIFQDTDFKVANILQKRKTERKSVPQDLFQLCNILSCTGSSYAKSTVL